MWHDFSKNLSQGLTFVLRSDEEFRQIKKL